MATYSDELVTLYKYRSLSGPYGQAAAQDILIDSRMYWQSPLSFNDPFDCSPNLVFGEDQAARDRWLKKFAFPQDTGLSRSQRRHFQRSALKRSPEAVAAQLTASFTQWMSESAVCCFSEINDSPLMWAHYADSHRGACFVFEESMDGQPLLTFEVTYSEVRPAVDLTRFDDDETFHLSVLTKATFWAYERERRTLDYRIPPGYRSFDPQRLSGVILGARISQHDQEHIVTLNKRRRESVPISKAILCKDRFALEIAPFDGS